MYVHIYISCVNRSCSFVLLYNTFRCIIHLVFHDDMFLNYKFQLIQLLKQEKVPTHSLYLVKVSSSKNPNH